MVARCPKCGGNVYLDRDHYGWHEECLQCGYSRDMQSMVDMREKAMRANLTLIEEEPDE